MSKYSVTPFVQCDANGCGHKEDIPAGKDLKDYIGAPCPACGANLCTQQDYDDYMILREKQKELLQMLGIDEASLAEVEAEAAETGEPVIRSSIHVHDGMVHTSTEL